MCVLPAPPVASTAEQTHAGVTAGGGGGHEAAHPAEEPTKRKTNKDTLRRGVKGGVFHGIRKSLADLLVLDFQRPDSLDVSSLVVDAVVDAFQQRRFFSCCRGRLLLGCLIEGSGGGD